MDWPSWFALGISRRAGIRTAFGVDSPTLKPHDGGSESAPEASQAFRVGARSIPDAKILRIAMSNAGFVHLHVHSAYSLLKGSIKIASSASSRRPTASRRWR